MKQLLLVALLIFLPLLAQAQTTEAGSSISQTSRAHQIDPASSVSVPYVACQEGGMAGDTVAPPGHPINLNMPSKVAAKLAFYYGLGLFVLAPRGWECESNQGADAAYLIVTPPGAVGYSRPGVFLENTNSDNNGTFLITAYGGTYFPKLFPPQDVNSAVNGLNEQGGHMTNAQFLAPKYTADSVAYVSGTVLEYRTPPNEMGLGISILSYGLPSDLPSNPYVSKTLSKLPTYGTIGLVKLPDYSHFYIINLLAIRLPPDLATLHSAIQDFMAHCQPFDKNAACASQIDFGQ